MSVYLKNIRPNAPEMLRWDTKDRYKGRARSTITRTNIRGKVEIYELDPVGPWIFCHLLRNQRDTPGRSGQ